MTRERCAEYYDYVVPYRERQDVAFYLEMARTSGGPVLELGCGTGRILIPTARAGIEIVGLDLSPAMLSLCREKLLQEAAPVQSRVELVQRDIRRFDLGREFALVTLPFRTFQHLLTIPDQVACLQCIHRHLVDGGTVILDLFNPSLPHLVNKQHLVESGEEPNFRMPDGRRVVRRHRIVSRNLFDQIQEIEMVYYVTHPDGRQERLVHHFTMRYLFRFEAEHLLERYGFQVQEVYADYHRSPYGSTYPGELIFVARKL